MTSNSAFPRIFAVASNTDFLSNEGTMHYCDMTFSLGGTVPNTPKITGI